MNSKNKLVTAILSVIALMILQKGIAAIGMAPSPWKAWPVKVCFATSLRQFTKSIPGNIASGEIAPLSDEEKKKVIGWIRSAYTPERTGISFVGFGDCPDEKNDQQVYLGIGVTLPKGTAGVTTMNLSDMNPTRWIDKILGRERKVGVAVSKTAILEDADSVRKDIWNRIHVRLDPEDRDRPEYKAAVDRYGVSLDDDLYREVVLHEFAHVTGLEHEDKRDDVVGNQPSFCRSRSTEYKTESTDKQEDSRFGTEFDPFSIVNYCRDEMIPLHHRAVLFCELGMSFVKGSASLGIDTKDLEKVLESCEFIKNTAFPVDLSKRDITALRNMYLGERAADPESLDYRKSETEVKWLEIFGHVDQAAQTL